jgi:Domain of unknown function (DUF4189)
MQRNGSWLFALLFGCVMLSPNPGAAEGALAVGLPSHVEKQGVALGYATKHPTKEKARAVALDKCKTAMDAPASTRALCKVIQTFTDQCVALAIDPKAGTPGVGWGIAADKESAEKVALQMCIETAGPSRREFCKTTDSACDR